MNRREKEPVIRLFLLADLAAQSKRIAPTRETIDSTKAIPQGGLMGLRDQISSDIKDAMRAKEMAKLNALRMVQSAFKNREIELRPEPMSEDEHITVIKKLVKQRKESIEQYQAAKRQDLVDAESAELKLLEQYLPAQMSRDQIEALVVAAIAATKASTIKDMGAVMKEVQAKSGGAADNKIVSELIKAKLTPK